MNDLDCKLSLGALQGYGCVVANENETLGKQSKVRTSMKQIYSDINNNKATIAANDSIIKSL